MAHAVLFLLLGLLGLLVLGALGLSLLYLYESANDPARELPAPRPPALAFALCFVGAFSSFLLCGLLRSLSFAFRDPLPQTDRKAALPVIMVHGLYDKPSAWLYLARYCARQGRTVKRFAYSTRGAVPQSLDGLFDAFMRQNLAELDGQRPILAGHSLGGLIIRNWLRDPANRALVSGVITLGTPHRGSKCAHLALGDLAASIVPGSPFIRELEEAEPLTPALPCVSLASPTDGAVLPASSLLPPDGWSFKVTKALGHYTMLFSPSVARMFEAELESIGVQPVK